MMSSYNHGCQKVCSLPSIAVNLSIWKVQEWPSTSDMQQMYSKRQLPGNWQDELFKSNQCPASRNDWRVQSYRPAPYAFSSEHWPESTQSSGIDTRGQNDSRIYASEQTRASSLFCSRTSYQTQPVGNKSCGAEIAWPKLECGSSFDAQFRSSCIASTRFGSSPFQSQWKRKLRVALYSVQNAS